MTWLSRLLPPSKSLRHNPSEYNRRSLQRRRRMTLESLEERVVLSNVAVGFDPTSGILTITPDQFNNQFKVTETGVAGLGRVRVEALPLIPGVFQTTINGTSVPFDSWEAVTKIVMNFQGGNDADVVQIVGPGAGTATTVKDVTMNLTSTTLTSLTVTGVNNPGVFSLTTAAGLPNTTISNSNFQGLSIVQTGAGASNVTLTNDTVSGPVGVALGNGVSRITVTGGSFGPTSFSQGTGAGDAVTVTNGTMQQLTVVQGSGAGDNVTVNGLNMSDVGTGLRVTQGAGNGDVVSITGAVTNLLAPPGSTTPPGLVPSIVVMQGAGIADRATIASSYVEGNVSITQGNGYNNLASITGTSAGFLVPANPPFIPAPVPFMGIASIMQGNGSGLTASITGGSFNGVMISQGTATVVPPAPTVPLPGTATVSGVSVYGNITINQQNAASAVGGTTASVTNSPSAQGSIAITQAAAPSMTATVTNSPAFGSIALSQGNGAGDRSTITGSNAGTTLSIIQGDGAGDIGTITGSSSGTGTSIAQGNGAGDSATITGGTVALGNISIAQGNGASDVASITGATATSGNISIAQGNGGTDSATLSGVTAPLGGLSISQGNGGGDTARLVNSSAGTVLSFGSYSMIFFGDVAITQGTGDGNTVDVDGPGTIGSLAITQGDAAFGQGTVSVDGLTIYNDLTINQGGGSSLGQYTANIATSASVSVGSLTTVNQAGGNNIVFLGSVLGGSSSLVSYFMSIFTGAVGGGLVAAKGVTVYDIYGPFVIDGGGTGNTYYDAGGNVGVTVSPNYNVFSI